ncbi:methyl-accepting chemotaxis protein [Marinobacter sp. M1N3S26]|uniref:methyl-accepting chemotaxis protein n=1 Tax=Marinobacter sp. M1N3S26 TaxID=3382299 RepID=UPI00387B50B0
MNLISRSILGRVLSVVLAANLLVAICAIFYFSHSLSSNREYHALASEKMVHALQAESVLNRFKTQVQEWKNVLIRGGDDDQRANYWQQFQEQEAEIQQALDNLVPQLPENEARSLLSRFQNAHRRMGQAYRAGFEDFVAADYDHREGDQAVQGIDREPAQLIEEASTLIREQALADASSLNESVTRNTTLIGIIMLAAILVGTLLCILVLSRTVVRPVRTLTDQLYRLGEGDLSSPATLRRNDELGRLADAARNLHGFLSETGSLMNRFSGQLSDTSQALQTNARQVADHSEQSHQRIEQIATAMNEMSATAQEVANHATSVSGETREASTEATAADERTQQASHSMGRLSEQIRLSAETVEKLAGDGRKVSEVMGVIREIADQTNLLALNAAIEAARAGEAGRGFAVVADEVRSLAAKTQEATTRIDGIVETITRGSNDATEFMKASEIVASETSEAVEAVRQTLTGISNRMAQINEATIQVATAAEEQTNVSDDINRNVTDVAETAEKMRESADENLRRVPELDTMAREATELSSRIRLAG